MRIDERTGSGTDRTSQLTRERVLSAAVGLADRDGIEAVSMRKLANELGIGAMSIYTYVRDKDDLLLGMADAVIGEIPSRRHSGAWRAVLRATILGARTTVLRHAWAPRIIETRPEPGPAALRHFDTIIGIFREGGFSLAMTHHALHLLGSRVIGFTQDLYDDSGDVSPEAAAMLASQLGATHPHVVEMALGVGHEGGLGGCDDDVEFAFALDFILDGLERLRDA